MQLLTGATKVTSTTETCGQALLDYIPPVMWFIRRNIRSHQTAGLSVPQFRALCSIQYARCQSLSEVSINMGSCLPTTSRLVTGLVKKGLLKREEMAGDRRRQKLVLTAEGEEKLEASRSETRKALDAELAKLTEEQRERITESLKWLGDVFGQGTAEGAAEIADEDEDCGEEA